MATRARTTKATPAKKTAAKKTTASKPAAKRTTPRKTTLTLVKPAKSPLPVRPAPFMTDLQGYATLAARIAGIPTPRITAWTDHRDGTTSRPLKDGTLHYHLGTRTLTWQATCVMGAVHSYRLDSPSAASDARVQAANCRQAHFNTSAIAALTPVQLAELGIIHTPAWAVPTAPGEQPTQSIPVALPAVQRAERARTLGDQLARSDKAADDTQSMALTEITATLEQPKEHPQP